MTIKTWFLEKNFDRWEVELLKYADLTIERETEKAYLFKASTDFGTKKFWCPKSCTEETPAVDPALIKKAAEQVDREDLFTKGTKVKNIGGRKIFTVTSDQVHYGCVWLDNGKKVEIRKLEIVA